MFRAQKIPKAMKTTPEPQDCTSGPMEPHLLHGRALSAIQRKCFQMLLLPARGSSLTPAFGALRARHCPIPHPVKIRRGGGAKSRQAGRLCWCEGQGGSDGSCLLEICPEEQPGHHLEAGLVGFKVGLRAVGDSLTQKTVCLLGMG